MALKKSMREKNVKQTKIFTILKKSKFNFSSKYAALFWEYKEKKEWLLNKLPTQWKIINKKHSNWQRPTNSFQKHKDEIILRKIFFNRNNPIILDNIKETSLIQLRIGYDDDDEAAVVPLAPWASEDDEVPPVEEGS